MIRLDSVSKAFGGFIAVDNLSLTIGPGEFFALLGASGSGKTTLLRLLGGFDSPTQGRIFIDGEDVTELRPNRRPTNTVFQSYALFPHLTLAENVGYGLLNARLPKAELSVRVAAALDRVRLGDLGPRFPHQVSGGQRQRVALARALICRPKVLLLDEPLGALDKRLREEMHIELRDIQRAAGITFILVTHDQEEAMSLADRVAVMARGRILQVDAPRRLYEAPASREVAEFISNVNLIEATCLTRRGNELIVAAPGLGDLAVKAEGVIPSEGARVTLALRPEKVRLVANPEPGLNLVQGSILATTYAGDRTHLAVSVQGLEKPILVTVPNSGRALAEPAQAGAVVMLGWEPDAAALILD
jgi:spermidine/putrescine ABC transporter ATP-binding subunit